MGIHRRLIIKYLQLAQTLARRTQSTHVSSEEALIYLHITPEKRWNLPPVHLTTRSSGSFGSNEWNAERPEYEDLLMT
jgi:hypothetical protein